MNKTGTDLRLIKKGIKRLVIALPLLFIGPYLITLGFLNKDNFWIYILLSLGIITAISAVFFAFTGINTITDAVFGPKKKQE